MASYDEEFVAAVSSIALAGDGLVLGAGMALLAMRTWLKYRSHAKAVKQLEDTPLSHIADLRSLLLLKPEEELARDGSKLEHNSRPVPQIANKEHQHRDLLVIVRGGVQPKSYVDPKGRGDNEQILVAENAGQKGVFVEKSQTFLYNERRGIFGWRLEWRGLFGWSSFKEKVTVSRKMVPFVLVEGFAGKRPAFTCVDLADSRHPLPLTTVYHQLHPAQASSYTFLQAMFGQRYMVGILDEEKILPIGKEITAVGLLTASLDGSPVIVPSNEIPYFLTDYTRDQLISEVAGEAKVLFWMGIVVSGIAAGVLAYAIIRNWGKWKHWRRERQIRKEEEKQTRLLNREEVDAEEDVPDGELCVICLLRRRRAAFVSCGHRVCCMSCAHKVVNDPNPRCPVCRHNVISVICVYDA